MTDKILVFSTCGSVEEARRVARGLVESRAAACVNIVPGVQSIYHWQGAVEESSEWLLVVKSSRANFERLKSELRKIHSYQVPEIVAVAIVDGAEDYLEWLERETQATGSAETP
jgi:periplasmic divalent cation tolerance protein